MFSGIKLRLTALGLAVAVMGALIAVVTLNSQRQGEALRAKLDQVDAESFGLAEHFKDTLREASDKLTHYRNTREPAAWQDFLKAGGELNSLIQDQLAKPSTPRELEVLKKMDLAYANFARVSGEVPQIIQKGGADGNLPPDLTDALSQARRRLFDLGQELSQAHLDLKQLLLAQAQHTLAQLRLTVLGALALLFLFGIALAALVYHDMIAPLRNQLVASQALLERNEKMAALGLLAAGLAHEIRNPLTAVKAALFTQQKKFPPDTPEHADVKIVEREISRLERIVTDFLNFARPSEPELKIMAADLLLLETQLFFAPQLAQHNIRINLEAGSPRHIKVDAGQLKQVLINLVRNAADGIGQDGTITLRTRQSKKPLLNGEKNAVILEVSDTGRGIPPEVQKRLFDPFFTTKENGTGLGLSIAARIVQKHGGVLQYQPQTKGGATFEIVLPPATE